MEPAANIKVDGNAIKITGYLAGGNCTILASDMDKILGVIRVDRDKIAELEAERDRLRELVKKLVDVKSEPDKLLCLLEREARRAMEE